jgi:hypothetical protein
MPTKVSCLLLPPQALLISQRILLSIPFKFLIGLSMAEEDSLQDSPRGVPGNIQIPQEDATVATAASVASQGSTAVFQQRAHCTLLKIEQDEAVVCKGCLVSGVKGLLRWSVPLFKSQLNSLVSAAKGLLRGLVPISHKKRRCSHHKHCTRAKAKDRVRRWRRQALPVALVVRCWCRSSNKAPCLVSDISEPVHWKWKKKMVGLSSVMSELKLSTLQGFCAVDHDFLLLPQLLKTFCDHDYHMRQIKLVLDRVALLHGTFEMHQSASDRLDPKTLTLIWDTGASSGLTPFWSDFNDYVECKIDVCNITKVNKVVGILAQCCTNLWTTMIIMFTCHVCLTIFQ